MEINQFVAGRAFIVKEDKVLIIREATQYKTGANIGKYDFPGGKFNPGENFKEALKRETKEEYGLDIEIKKPFYVAEWWPTAKNGTVQIIGIFFKCIPASDSVVLSSDHDEYKWININEYKDHNLIKENADACNAYLKL
jgi:8-oxo-dGTP diphosphatase